MSATKRKVWVRSTAHRKIAGRRGRPSWADLGDEELQNVRFRDLGVKIAGTPLEGAIERVLGELSAREISFRPHFWLSEEWFSPERVPGVAIPFYLAHPRLARLERSQMLEVEGSTRRQCLRLLRHEVGHAVQQAFQLHRLRAWRETFGRASLPYPDHYAPDPTSRAFVLHLDNWYAQSHPVEDFAETFAVWLKPRSDWRARYACWPLALHKLRVVDQMMRNLAGRTATVRDRSRPFELSRLRTTLRRHYQRKVDHYGVGAPERFDAELQQLFTVAEAASNAESAAAFVRRHQREFLCLVTGPAPEFRYARTQVLRDLLHRCHTLKLRAPDPERRLKLDFTIALATRTRERLRRKNLWLPV